MPSKKRTNEQRQELKRLVRLYLRMRDCLAAGYCHPSLVRRHREIRDAVIDHLRASPLPVITARRMYERYGHILQHHVGILSFEDLLAIAYEAIVGIVDDFDPSHGHSIQKCAINRMRQAILREIRKAFRGGRGAMENLDRRIYSVCIDDEISPWEGDRLTYADTIPSDWPLPWHEVQRSQIRSAVGRLPYEEQAVVWRKHFEDLSIERAGETVGLGKTAAHAAYRRGLDELRALLGEYADGIDEK